MNSELVLSKEWWDVLTGQLCIPSTYSSFPIYMIFIFGLMGMALFRIKRRIPKILFVVLMGALELYYFGCFALQPDWFLSSDVIWLQRIITVPTLVTILTTQSLLTDDIFLADSLDGEQRRAADTGICFSPLLLTAVYGIITIIIVKWLKSYYFAVIVGYIALICIIGVIARLIQVKRLGNISILLFLVSIISLSGILITSSYCIWTGVITLFAYISFSSKRRMRSVAYSIKLRADSGDSDSIFRMGRIYLIGDGIPKDEIKAVEYFQKSAEKGNAKAYKELSDCYLKGKGVSIDKIRAIELANKSLELGCTEAKKTLGDIYFEQAKDYRDGIGVLKNEQKAIDLFWKSTEFENTKAYNALARCYLSGMGVPEDGSKGLELAMKSYEMGNKNACAIIGTYYRMGKFIPEDHVNGHKWDIIGAQAGNVLCQMRLAIDSHRGYGVPINKREACRWYKKVADNKDADKKDRGMASYRYGVLIGCLGNELEGKEYIRKAQKLGDKTALENGDKYLNL